jgi:simple sugar transport system ATP-binding protein
VLRNMKAQNCAVIIITHKLAEVMEISDRVTVLRHGKVIGTVSTPETSPEALTAMMVGANISLDITREKVERSARPVLQVRRLSVANREMDTDKSRPALDDLNFDLYGGEILGVAGIAGSGQRELAEAICGLARPSAGEIDLDNENLASMSPLAIRKKGMRLNFVPEDRLGMGLAGGMSITDNVLLKSFSSSKGFFLDRAHGREEAEAIVKKYDVSTPGVNHLVRKLSGGNIQKVLLGREIEKQPRVLITAYPVRGLDINASLFVYEMLNKQKAAGVAILFIGEDLDVLLQLCDRIMVLHAGTLMGILDADKTDKNQIGAMMLGQGAKG